jgi:FkbM family methyltransferase
MNVDRALQGLRHVRRAGELMSCLRTSPDWAPLISGYLGLAELTYPRTFSTRDGDKLRLEDFHDLITAWIIFFRKEYKVDPNARVIVDAGANIGAFSLYAARRAPRARIIALEPFPRTAARLSATVESNDLGSRVVQRQLALSASDGHRRMPNNEAPSQSRNVLSEDVVDGFTVESLTLATFLDRESLDRVDLMKMDIEGAEHQVLRNASKDVLRRIGTLALEYHPNESKEELFTALHDAGFALADDRPIGLNCGVAEFRQRYA